MAITTIVFDFGGVLVDWNPRYVFRELLPLETEMETFLKNVTTEEWNMEQDRGRTLAEGTRVLVETFPDHRELIEAYYGRWEEMLGGDIPGTVALLHELKQAFPVYGLTNWSAETFPVALRRYPFFALFDGILVSGEEKLVKPDPAIFHLLMKRFNLVAEECLFIDDNRKNIAAATALGFNCIHFESPEKLSATLESMGLIRRSMDEILASYEEIKKNSDRPDPDNKVDEGF